MSTSIFNRQYEILKADGFRVEKSDGSRYELTAMRLALYYIVKTMKIHGGLVKSLQLTDKDLAFLDKHTTAMNLSSPKLANKKSRFYKNSSDGAKACDLINNLHRQNRIINYNVVQDSIYLKGGDPLVNEIMIAAGLPSVDELRGEGAYTDLLEASYTPKTKHSWFNKVSDFLKDFGIYSNDDYEKDMIYIEPWTVTLNTKHVKMAEFTPSQIELARKLNSITHLFPNGKHTNKPNTVEGTEYRYPDHHKQIVFIDRDSAVTFCNHLRKADKDPSCLLTPFYIDTPTLDKILTKAGRPLAEFQGENAIELLTERVKPFSVWLAQNVH